jgi:uncharacterized metal-binding protein YceD (DUF177 family)
MTNYLNLREGKFPIKIDTFIENLSDGLNLGTLKTPLSINLSIDKLSSDLFSCKGVIESCFLNSCQICLKEAEISVSLDTDLIIRDVDVLLDFSNKPDESHFQNLKYFQIEKLVEEEICLNYPGVIKCNSKDCLDFTQPAKEEKLQPFKKIRDLLE